MASGSTWHTRKSSLHHSNGSTRKRSSRVPASAWRRSSGSSTGTAAPSGRRQKRAGEPRFGSRSEGGNLEQPGDSPRRRQSRRRRADAARVEEEQHRQRGHRRQRRRRGARFHFRDRKAPGPRPHDDPGAGPSRPEAAEGRRTRGATQDQGGREEPAPSGRHPDLLEGGAGPRERLRSRRQQLHSQAGRFCSVHRGGPTARALLARPERAATHTGSGSTVTPLRALVVEDSEDDAALLAREMRSGDVDFTYLRVETAEDMKAALASTAWDVVISDYNMPRFSAPAALRVLKESGLDLPFIVVSGTVGEDVAVETMKEGAHDYILKGNLTRLLPAVRREIEQAANRQARLEGEAATRKLSHAVEQTPATVMITDLGGRIEYVNPRFTKVTGYTAEEALGQNPRILKSDRTPPEVHRAIWETIAAGRVWQGELCNRKKDGTLFWESASISPVRDEQGVTTSYVAVKEDITDRKRAAENLAKSEIYFRSLIENAQDVIVVIDAGGDLLFMSPAVERTLGRPPEQFVGKNAFEFIHPEDAAGVQAALRRVVDDPQLPQTVVFRFRHANGSWRTMEGIGKLLAAEGSPRAVVNVRDVTESRALEEQLRQSQKMEAVGRLAGGVAHDFNNLLTVIFGYSDILLQGLEPGPLYEAMQEVRRASERAAALTRQLLAFSRKQTLVPEVLDLGNVVSGMSTMVERLIGEEVKVSVVVSPGLGRVKADRGHLEQVLMNLAVNARDAMPKGGSLTFHT